VIVAMVLPLVVSVLLGASAPRLGRRLPPATAARLLTAAMLGAAVATGFVLGVAGTLAVGQIPQVAAEGHWSARALGSGLPVPAAVGGVAAMTVCALLVAALRRAAKAGRDLVRAAVTCRRLGPHVGGLIVIQDEEPDAYTLPGLGGRVVVSTAMLRALPAGERRVLLAHEAAHLAHHHHLWVQAANLASAANPVLRPAARAVQAAVERWADEVAAGEVGDRAAVGRAVAAVALGRSRGAVLAGNGVDVVARVGLLLRPPPAPRRRTAVLLLLAVLACWLAAATVITHVHALMELAEAR
jgi:beta-lactamase regulating signal transducer with metallopeptidase domain